MSAAAPVHAAGRAPPRTCRTRTPTIPTQSRWASSSTSTRGTAGALRAPYNAAGTSTARSGRRDVRTTGSACASCHDPADGGADRRRSPTRPAWAPAYTIRNAPTVINAAYSPLWQFWDGRADSLWSQALVAAGGPERMQQQPARGRAFPLRPLPDRNTRRCSARGRVSRTLPRFPASRQAGRRRLQEHGGRRPATTVEPHLRELRQGDRRLRAAPRQQQLRAVAVRSVHGGRQEAMSSRRPFRGAQAVRRPCRLHRVPPRADVHATSRSTTSARRRPANTCPPPICGRYGGIAALRRPSQLRSTATASSATTRTTRVVGTALGTTAPQSERSAQFKTPTLRNVSKTAPYMHDGAYQTLWDVVNHYNFGGATGTMRAKRIRRSRR